MVDISDGLIPVSPCLVGALVYVPGSRGHFPFRRFREILMASVTHKGILSYGE